METIEQVYIYSSTCAGKSGLWSRVTSGKADAGYELCGSCSYIINRVAQSVIIRLSIARLQGTERSWVRVLPQEEKRVKSDLNF